MFSYHNCNDFEKVVEECEGCDFISTRITNGDKICNYSMHPEREWFWGLCSRATHIEKEE